MAEKIKQLRHTTEQMDDAIDKVVMLTPKVDEAQAAAASAAASATKAANSLSAINNKIDELKGSGDIDAATVEQVSLNTSDISNLKKDVLCISGGTNFLANKVYKYDDGALSDEDGWCVNAEKIPVIGGTSIEWVFGIDGSIGGYNKSLLEYNSNGEIVDKYTNFGENGRRIVTLNNNTAYICASFGMGIDGVGIFQNGNIVFAPGEDNDINNINKRIDSVLSKIDDVRSGIIFNLGDIEPIETSYAYIYNNIGERVSKTPNSSYICNKYPVSEKSELIITLGRRNEDFFWCYFVDGNDIVIDRCVTSSPIDFDVIENYHVISPKGARFVYLMSFLEKRNSISCSGVTSDTIAFSSALNKDIHEVKEQIFQQNPSENAFIYTDFIEVKPGSKVTWLSAVANNIPSLYEYNSDKKQIDYWTFGIPRTITINNANTKYIRAVFLTKSTSRQYLSVDEVTMANMTIGELYSEIAEVKALIDTGSYGMPKKIFDEGMIAYKRMQEWANGDDIYILGQITDVHSGGNDKYKYVSYLNNMNMLFGFDVMVNAGDIGLDTPDTNGDITKQMALIANTKYGMDATSPWIFCKGNHECVIETSILSNCFTRPLAKQYDVTFGDTKSSYGYMDSHNTRLIFLNTSDANVGIHYNMSKEQLQWLVNCLKSVEQGYKVIIVSHLMPHIIGAWKSDGTSIVNMPCFIALRGIIEAYASKTSGRNDNIGVTWDFSQSKGSFVCILSGDSHFNNYIKQNGVNYIVRQGFGGVGVSDMADGSTRADVEDICCDVLAVKQNGSAKIFRIGAGGAEYDLAITI